MLVRLCYVPEEGVNNQHVGMVIVSQTIDQLTSQSFLPDFRNERITNF